MVQHVANATCFFHCDLDVCHAQVLKRVPNIRREMYTSQRSCMNTPVLLLDFVCAQAMPQSSVGRGFMFERGEEEILFHTHKELYKESRSDVPWYSVLPMAVSCVVVDACTDQGRDYHSG